MTFWKFVEFTSVACRAIKCATCATALWTFEFGDSAKRIPFRALQKASLADSIESAPFLGIEGNSRPKMLVNRLGILASAIAGRSQAQKSNRFGAAKEAVLRLPDASLGRFFAYGDFAPSDPLHSVNEM
jgi:hypothetical protein